MMRVTQVMYPPKIEEKKKVAAYARVSSGKDAMLHSLSAQVSYYSNLIQENNEWEFAGVYSDEAITGTKENREGFQKLLNDCKERKIDMIITKSISRFARNTVTLLKTVRMLKEMGVDVYFEEQNIHTTSGDGELMLSILASYAQEESLSASENQKWRVRKNFEEGKPWSTKLFGYRYKDDHFVIFEEEAVVVRRIFSEYLNGAGPCLIAKRLTFDGVPTRHGKPWHERTIVGILKNYNYTGNLILQKTFRENHITKRKMVNTGEKAMYHIENAHEAIIDMETFYKVQEEMERRSLKANRAADKKTYPYTGKIVCAKCGKNYKRRVTKTQAVWMCSTYNSKGKAFCASKQIPESVLDEIFKEVESGKNPVLKIEADDGNILRFYMTDGSIKTRIWEDKPKCEYWTEERKAKAREKELERRQAYGKEGNNNHSCNEG